MARRGWRHQAPWLFKHVAAACLLSQLHLNVGRFAVEKNLVLVASVFEIRRGPPSATDVLFVLLEEHIANLAGVFASAVGVPVLGGSWQG